MMKGNIDKTALTLLIGQVLLIILFWIFGTYQPKYESEKKYPMFQDVQVMIFVGFACLLTFLKRYCFSSLGFTLLLGAFVIQWSMLCQGFYRLDDNYKIELGIESMYQAEFAAAAVLISHCAVLGKTSMMQMIVLGFIEVIIYWANIYVVVDIFKIADAGGSIFVHAFGAYFGLAMSYVMAKRQHGDDVKQEAGADSLKGSNYMSDIFAMIGTLLLWIYWPSFNAIELEGIQQGRAVLNTYLSLASCCLSTFAASLIFSSGHKLDMVHIQNGTLAGGVAVGAAVHLLLGPGGAMTIGFIAGFLCVFGFEILTPRIEKFLKIPDVCGINNLHGMPGIFAGIISAIMAGIATESDYHKDLYDIYPARRVNIGTLGMVPRSAGMQAVYQILGTAVTIGIAVITGVLTGYILTFVNPLHPRVHFDDSYHWKIDELSTLEENKSGKSVQELKTNSHESFDVSSADDRTTIESV